MDIAIYVFGALFGIVTASYLYVRRKNKITKKGA